MNHLTNEQMNQSPIHQFYNPLCPLPSVFCHLSSVFCPLHLSRALYKSALFMQNKANLPDAKMNVTTFITKEYENISNWKLGENKANTKPNKANLLDAQMNISSLLTKHYENVRLCRRGENKPKQSQFLYHWLRSLFIIAAVCKKGRYINSSPVNRTTRYEIREYD